MTRNRRRHERIVIDAPVKVSSRDALCDARLHDLSVSGAAVEFSVNDAPFRLDIGDRVTLTPQDGSRRSGRVVRQYERGIGIVFDDDGDGA